MAVAWALNAWATDSWVGMNGGPPNAWRGESTVVVTEVPGGSSRKRRKDRQGIKPNVIRWSDFANQEERAKALAAALAESSVSAANIEAATGAVEFDEIEDEENALIAALVLARVIH